MDYKDYYAVLGVPRTASENEIKKAFRKLAREHHPDVKAGDAAAEKRFKEVNEANAVLSDPDKRALYDRLGADWEAYARAGAGAGAGAGARGERVRAGPARSGPPVRRQAGRRPLRVPHDRRRGRVQRLLQCLLRRRLGTGQRSRPRPATHRWPDLRGHPRRDGARRGRRRRLRSRRRHVTRTRIRGRQRHDRSPAPPRHGRGDRRDHPRRGLSRHHPARRCRGKASRGHDPARRRHGDTDPPDRQGPRRRRSVRRGPPAARRRPSHAWARISSGSCR